MNNFYTDNNTNGALEFAYAMGLKRPETAKEEKADSALTFAYAMGLKRNSTSENKAPGRFNKRTMVPQLRFI